MLSVPYYHAHESNMTMSRSSSKCRGACLCCTDPTTVRWCTASTSPKANTFLHAKPSVSSPVSPSAHRSTQVEPNPFYFLISTHDVVSIMLHVQLTCSCSFARRISHQAAFGHRANHALMPHQAWQRQRAAPCRRELFSVTRSSRCCGGWRNMPTLAGGGQRIPGQAALVSQPSWVVGAAARASHRTG